MREHVQLQKTTSFDTNLIQHMQPDQLSKEKDLQMIPTERRGSLLQKLRLQKRKTSIVSYTKEYRIVSAGEDGAICFWLFSFEDLAQTQIDQKVETEIRPKDIEAIKPVMHQHFTDNPIQTLAVGRNYLMFVSADGGTFVFKGTHKLIRKDDESEVQEEAEEFTEEQGVNQPT